MVGRRSRRWHDDDPDTHGPAAKPLPVCPLCERPIPGHARSSLHHLTPRLKGGTHRGTVRLHQICHSAIHARYSEAEIARRLADVDALRADPEIAGFLAWVRGKPDDFHAPTRMTRDRRASKRRD
ncbi:restriction endonuclease [Methylobacterium sp. NEAU 140]|uniref:restriction endonuclease n=1 Tax=Methylobacterium sp. NEAU 140 TaxID=3064945 RepID=UPI002733CB4E|nr:restriction endonuclease [Methylobacterium sp. NEAU 140]MDP4021860.1 restriction endonuclease [Methylobacterium sp. NEAU 140]